MIHVFYHVACMFHWREIVSEQLKILAGHPNLRVRIGFTGSKSDSGFLYHLGTALNLDFEIMFVGSGNHNYEYPTIERLHKECVEGKETDPVLYFHTKGASKPGDWHSMMWRWYMNAKMLDNLTLAQMAIEHGHGWAAPIISQGIGPGPHTPGNFWMSSREHIRKLPEMQAFRKQWNASLPKWNWIGDRHGAEAWIGYAEGNPCVLADNGHRIWESSWWVKNPEIQQMVSRA
jgi:hypothetical protein